MSNIPTLDTTVKSGNTSHNSSIDWRLPKYFLNQPKQKFKITEYIRKKLFFLKKQRSHQIFQDLDEIQQDLKDRDTLSLNDIKKLNELIELRVQDAVDDMIPTITAEIKTELEKEAKAYLKSLLNK